MMYGIKQGRGAKRRVAHLTDGEFQPALCERPITITTNVPWGHRVCRDCARIQQTTVVVRVRR